MLSAGLVRGSEGEGVSATLWLSHERACRDG